MQLDKYMKAYKILMTRDIGMHTSGGYACDAHECKLPLQNTGVEGAGTNPGNESVLQRLILLAITYKYEKQM